MVAPIYGPFNVDTSLYQFYEIKRRYKQRAPYTLPANYQRYSSRRTYCVGEGYNPGPASGYVFTGNQVSNMTETNQAKIAAYERLKANIVDRASMGENLVDINKSVKTVITRASQLLRFTNAVKRGHFGDAARILRTPEPRNRHPIKESANNWLEYHLGIEPVVRDIWAAIDLIQQPVKPKRVKGTGVGLYEAQQLLNPYQASVRWQAKIRVLYQCDVAVSNPTLWLANSLGILNPVQVLWQVIPLSFVLDWFANVEQFFGTSTDFWGLSTQNAFTTVTWRGTKIEWWPGYGWKASWDTPGIMRTVGLTLPTLSLRPYKVPSWQRAATAVALLVGGLSSLDTKNYRPDRRKLVFRSFEPNIQGRIAPPHRWTDVPRKRGDL